MMENIKTSIGNEIIQIKNFLHTTRKNQKEMKLKIQTNLRMGKFENLLDQSTKDQLATHFFDFYGNQESYEKLIQNPNPAEQDP